MVRTGQDVSEKLGIVPAEYFVHRHMHRKWACKCCQLQVQKPVAAQIIDGGMKASGQVAYTMFSHFVDLPQYRLEGTNARSGVHTPRSTLASGSGKGGAALQPRCELHKSFIPKASCCMPMRGRWRCRTPAQARPRTRSPEWSATSASGAGPSTRLHSCAKRAGRRRSHGAGHR